jgi:hypothetical protein
MTTRTYVNFDLRIKKEADGSYAAIVTGSPRGVASSVRFDVPFDTTTLENLLLKLDPGRTGTRRAGSSVAQQAAMEFGGPLYDAIFRDEVLQAWSDSLKFVREEGVDLRLRLRLKDAAQAAGLPWELLYDKPNNNFLARSEHTPLVRYLDVASVPKVITVDGPLRVLAIIASPTDLPPLAVEDEWARLNEAMADRIARGSVVLHRLPKPLVAGLGRWLRRHETHVIHFVGHGDFDERLREGVVYFENEYGARAAVTSSILGPFVRDHDPLRMVVLNACRSARTDALDPFGGIAQGLVQQDATAVVAMQFPISDRAAVVFTEDFYGSMVDGLPVDQAITSARKALLGGFQDEWATPVLFLQAPDGAIFEDVHSGSLWRRLWARAAGGLRARASRRTGDDGRHDRWPTAAKVGIPAGAAVLGIVAFVALGRDGGDDDRATEALPVAATSLSNDELLLAAGPSTESLNIYLVDVNTRETTPVTQGETRKAGPSISEQRDTLIFTERIPGTDYFQLRTVDPATGDGDTVLWDQRPDVCDQSMERPARSPVDPDVIISPCIDSRDRYRLVELNLATGAHRILDEDYARFGDPTISPDGDVVVYWASTSRDASAGSLYSLRFTDQSEQRTKLTPADWVVGDAVFSPVDDLVAFTRNVGKDRDLYTHRLGDSLPPQPLIDGGEIDQDPTWSPEGRRLAFRRGDPGELTRIWFVDLEAPDLSTAAEPILTEPIEPDYTVEIVPAWSRR